MYLKRLSHLTRKPGFWIAQLFLFVLSTYFAIHYYSKAFPTVDFQIKMDRLGALKAAYELATVHHWRPTQFRQSARFDLDDETQTFVELTAGGNRGFSQVLKEGLYSPYTWKVRHFAEGQINETYVRFTPQGSFYGFHESLAETEKGSSLSSSEALLIAESSAKKLWGLDFSPFKLAESSQETLTSKRTDHTFVYERTHEKIGEGRYRLKLKVSGDRLTEIKYFIKIPDAFSRRYTEMRSFNNTVSIISSVTMVILYILGGCGLGIFFLLRKRWLLWRTPLILATLVATFQLFEQINHLPLIWMSYDTAVSATGFLLRYATSFLLSFILEIVLLTLSFIAAESLTRKAFAHHPQLWRVWIPENAASISILGRTLGGYLGVGFLFAYVVAVYIIGTQYFGWWMPSETLFQPDGLATYCPWFTSIANSLHAGFWEECLFRAVPLAGAALLGQHFGHRKKFLAFAFVVQAIVFASAHANYPAQPSYARVLELIIPSFVFGGIYLLFGLLPGIILHFTFDVISFSLPLFASSTPNIWIDRTLVILFALAPLWVVLFSRIRTEAWTGLSLKEYNQSWHPPKLRAERPPVKIDKLLPLNQMGYLLLVSAGAACLIFWVTAFHFKHQTQPLEIERTKAIELARKALEDSFIHLSSSWTALASTSANLGEAVEFIWRTEPHSLYESLTGNYLTPPCWLVRFVRFDTSVEERAEEYQVYVAGKGEIFRIRHELPEARAGAFLEETAAKKIALSTLEQQFHLDSKVLTDVSSTASKLPNRRDWWFVFSDSSVPLKIGEARVAVRIAGDEAVAYRRFIFVPESWTRAERNRENMMGIIKIVSSLTLSLIFIYGIILSILSWAHKKFSTKIFFTVLPFLAFVGIIDFLNNLPGKIAQFTTEEPVFNQTLALLAFGAVRILFISGGSALILGYLHNQARGRGRIPPRFSALGGYAIGITGTFVLGACTQIFPSQSPTWGNLEALNSFFPALSSLRYFEKFILLGLGLSLVGLMTEKLTSHWTQRKLLGIVFLFMVSFSLSGTETEWIKLWIFSGFVGGMYLTLASRFWIRSNISLLPLASGGILGLMMVRQIIMGAYPGVFIQEGLSLIFILSVSYFWHRKLEKQGSLRDESGKSPG